MRIILFLAQLASKVDRDFSTPDIVILEQVYLLVINIKVFIWPGFKFVYSLHIDSM